MNITGFFHGKLRDTYRFPSKVETNDDFLEKLKDETFGESSTYSVISDKKQLMVVSLRKWKGQLFSVFTYFITSHDAANRPGGYVAITVIIQDYLVTDRIKLFSIFEEALNKLQLEQVLNNNKILIESFDEKKSFFSSLIDDITSCIANFCGPFIPIPEYSKNGDSTAFNTEDCNGDTFVKSLNESGVSYVSKSFMSMKENNEYKKKYEKAAATIEQLKQASDAASNLNKQKVENDRISKLQSDNAKLKEQNASLKKQIDDVKAEIDSVDKKVQGTKNIFVKSAKKVIDNDSPWIRLSIVFPLINTILLITLLYLVSANLNGLKKKSIGESSDTGIVGNLGTTATYTDETVKVLKNEQNGIPQKTTEGQGSEGVTPCITKTKDVIINVTDAKGTIIKNGGKVESDELLNVTCKDSVAKDYELYDIEGYNLGTEPRTIKVLGSSHKNVKFYFCHPDDKDVPFEKQPNRRTLIIK